MQHHDLTAWILDRVAQYCRRRPDEIGPDDDLTDHGMDSVLAMSLVGDIEDHLQIQLPATAVWDHPTANLLVEHISGLRPAEGDVP